MVNITIKAIQITHNKDKEKKEQTNSKVAGINPNK